MSGTQSNLVWSLVVVVVALAAGLAGFYLGRVTAPRSEAAATPSPCAPGPDDPSITSATLPARTMPIIDVHEHLLDEQEARRVLPAMDALNIRLMVLMGTPQYTLTLDRRYGFEQHLEHNEEMLRIAARWPDRFLVFPTLLPSEPGNLERVKDYVARGAQGIKLYLGHGESTGKGPFHEMPLDDERLKPFYHYAESTQLPLMYHINLQKYGTEFARVMKEFPHLRVCLPHFGLSKNDQKRIALLERLFSRYPNLYIDVSFGWHKFQEAGFRKLAVQAPRFRELLTRFANRFLFGTDMVLERNKTDDYITDTLRSYMQLLEMPKFRFFLKPDCLWTGLALPPETLKAIYWDTPRAYLLLDEQGRPPDRRRGWPWPGYEGKPMPGLPATAPAGPPQ